MPQFLLRPAQYLLIVALFFALGGHWVVLQSVAWGRMIVEYSQQSSVKEAVVKTFDGQHPCDLCTTLSKAREKEKKSDVFLVIKKIEMIQSDSAQTPFRTGLSWKVAIVDRSARMLSIEPALPPPRLS